MTILDVLIITMLFFYVLHGIYKGFVPTAFSIGSDFVSWLFAMIMMPFTAQAVENNAELFKTLLYYSEGSEFIGNVELASTSINNLSPTQVASVLESSNLPYPFAKEIAENISRQSFSRLDITTLGDYFNQTIVCVVINIIVFLFIFAIAKTVLTLIMNGVDYSVQLPSLVQYEKSIAAGCGLLHGILSLFVFFMVVPLILLVLNFDFIQGTVNDSLFTPFFYRANFLLSMIPGT